MIKSVYLVFGVSLLVLSVLLLTTGERAGASSVQVRPLMYQEELAPGESKKGFVDVSNGSSVPVTINLSVKGFKQIDSEGNLEFFPNQELNKGILLDLDEVELGPREAVRVYFIINGKKLPQGDVFAAIFARTKATVGSGITPSAEVGTLLIIENGEGGPRDAAIVDLSVPFLNLGKGIEGEVALRNSADPAQATGFFPNYSVTLGPVFGESKEFRGPLVFAGITRTAPFELQTERLGFYKVQVQTSGGYASKWVFIATGIYKWILLTIMLSMIGVTISLVRAKRRSGINYSGKGHHKR